MGGGGDFKTFWEARLKGKDKRKKGENMREKREKKIIKKNDKEERYGWQKREMES